MEIRLQVGTAADFWSKGKTVAQAADERRPVDLHESRLSLYFETEDDLNEAIASAWVHAYEPQAFHQYPTFASPQADPLVGMDKSTRRKIARDYGKQPVWIRRQPEGGMDIRGTVGVSVLPGSNLAVLPVGVRLAMEHLSFLSRWDRSSTPQVGMTQDHKIQYVFPVGRGEVVGMYVQMLPGDNPLLDGLRHVIHSGGDLVILVPKTVNALDRLDTFPGGNLASLPLNEMLHVRMTGLGRPVRKGSVMEVLTHEEIDSISLPPVMQPMAASASH